jgi:chromosomal replication initiation ATPase DnaA
VTIWDQILERLRASMPAEDFHRWFGATAYASDSSDQITVWVPSEAIRRYLAANYLDELRSALQALDRAGTHVRFVVGGTDDDDDGL